jgi:xanthine dehydrogenase accessory factor
MDIIVQTACELLDKNENIVLATIIQQQGSAPRMAGTRMLIAKDQRIYGTIGGGLLEARTMQAAQEIHKGAACRILTFDLSNEDAAVMEMICGGRVQVLLDRIVPTDENKRLFAAWREGLANGGKSLFVTVSGTGPDNIDPIAHALVGPDGILHGDLPISETARGAIASEVIHSEGITVQPLEDKWVVTDSGQLVPTVYIFGAGHVAQPTAKLAAMVGFRVVVLDDRIEFANSRNFPDAAKVHVLTGFDHATAGLPIGSGDYIIIVTRGHLHDKEVLAESLRTPAAYIGMIGSRRKRDTIYGQLLREGFTQADIKRVHSPIGLAIGADTPEEIAVSIVAEMISVRRNDAHK